jgi:two-component system cell cycle sensor histidine kinase/response regulator CckA
MIYPLRSVGEGESGWSAGIAWEPLLRLAIRAIGARAAWLRVGDEVRILSAGPEVTPATEAWITSISRRGAYAEFTDDTSNDARGISVWLGHEGGTEPGSVGVVLPPPSTGAGFDTLAAVQEERAILTDVARSLRSELAHFRGATSTAEAERALYILGKAVQNMQLGVTITDADGKIVYTNPAEARMHGYRPEELIGQHAHLLGPSTQRRAIYVEGKESDNSWTRETTNRHRDGREFPVLLWSDVIEDRDGGFSGVVTCSEDLTHRREVEAALRRSESMFRAIFDDAPVGLALLGDDSWIIRANPRLCSMLGIDGEPSPDRRLVDFAHPDDSSSARGFYARALGHSPDATRHEHRLGARDGEFVWANTTISPIFDANGRGRLWIALVEDNTQRRSLEEQFRHSQKMEAVGRLAGGVAHDFNNLLTAIRGISELLLLESGDDHPMAEDIREIHKAADTAADLTRQLLAFSRKQVTHYHAQNLNGVVLDSEKMLRRLLGDEVDLQLDLADDLQPVMGDQSPIEQVILNLLVNARDAMPDGGTIRLSTRNVTAPPRAQIGLVSDGPFVELAVRDSGTGIDPALLDQIFDPFFTTKPKGRGTGLGLSTVYGIVKQADGHIHVDSTVGEGTTFRIWFPVADPNADLVEPALEPARTVLVLRTDAEQLNLMTALLHDAGLRVLAADSVEEASTFVETYGDRIHLLVTEQVVEGGCGSALARKLREIREDMAVAVLTEGKPTGPGDDGCFYLDRGLEEEVMLDAIYTLVEPTAQEEPI